MKQPGLEAGATLSAGSSTDAVIQVSSAPPGSRKGSRMVQYPGAALPPCATLSQLCWHFGGEHVWHLHVLLPGSSGTNLVARFQYVCGSLDENSSSPG